MQAETKYQYFLIRWQKTGGKLSQSNVLYIGGQNVMLQ